mgnify:FL=1|tara:strand:- start:1321 stop:1461 length:141 start_codon:yes stop_codon:yes gene_type:complete
MNEQDRIKELKSRLALLQREVSEIQFLINGYENAIKESNEKKSKAS